MSRLLRFLPGLACLLMVSTLGAVPASAASTYLCTGYAGCAKAGMSEAGYQVASAKMWWRMYAGHNCTNYVAYRLVKNGMSAARPWSGNGNASNWGITNAKLTNTTPAVGAVAWWGANVRPAGSAGHVAYVEQVVSADEIIVSQDSWGGDFSWSRITRVGGSWPGGFIHFTDVSLTNSVKPALSGTARVGSTLSASPGVWSPSVRTYQYQWRANGVAIAGAKSSSLSLTNAQLGKKIAVRITAAELGYPKKAASSGATAAVEPGEISNTVPPAVSGTAKVDSALTATPGTWTPATSALGYQWSADGIPIPGATSSRLVPGADLVGKALTVTVTASKDGYTDVAASSVATSPVARGTFSIRRAATMTGTPRLGENLHVTTPRFTPATADVSVQWLRAGNAIANATGSTYQLVPADLGKRVSARMTLTRPGYLTLSATTASTALVKSVPVTTSVTKSGKDWLRLRVDVDATGVAPVTGVVRIKSRGKVVGMLPLHRGFAAITLRGLSKGSRSFAIRYVGSRTVAAASVRRNVRIR